MGGGMGRLIEGGGWVGELGWLVWLMGWGVCIERQGVELMIQQD